MLFTVLGELVLPTGGEAWTSAFIDVFGRLGVEEKAARQALMRTAADNWLSSERVGRRTVWRLTPAAERLLRDGTERIFGFTAVAGGLGRPVDDRDRAHPGDRAGRPARDPDRLRWAGFGNVMPGVWLSPRSDRGGEVRQILDEAGLPDGYLFAAEYQGGSSLAGLVGQAWDLDRAGPRVRRVHRRVQRGRRAPTRWPGSSSWCTPGAGSRGSTRACRPSSCPRRGAGPRPPACSPGGTPNGPAKRSRSGGSCWSACRTTVVHRGTRSYAGGTTSADDQPTDVSVRQFVADSGSVTRGLRQGRTWTLTLNGEPLAKLVPIETPAGGSKG